MELLVHFELNTIIYRDRRSPSEELAFAILLQRLSFPHRIRDLEVFFGMAYGPISSIFNDVLQHIYKRYKTMLDWHPSLTHERCSQYAAIFEQQGGIPGCWACVDGTFRAFCRPIRNQRIYYSGYKKKHGFKYQGIVTPDGLILSLKGPVEGKCSDITLFRIMNTAAKLQELQSENEPLYLYGDIAYQSCFGVITAFRQNQQRTMSVNCFNDWHASHRITIEQMFGATIMQWQANSLTTNLRSLSQSVAAWYAVSVLLINCLSCLRGNCSSARYKINTMSLREYLIADIEVILNNIHTN